MPDFVKIGWEMAEEMSIIATTFALFVVDNFWEWCIGNRRQFQPSVWLIAGYGLDKKWNPVGSIQNGWLLRTFTLKTHYLSFTHSEITLTQVNEQSTRVCRKSCHLQRNVYKTIVSGLSHLNTYRGGGNSAKSENYTRHYTCDSQLHRLGASSSCPLSNECHLVIIGPKPTILTHRVILNRRYTIPRTLYTILYTVACQRDAGLTNHPIGASKKSLVCLVTYQRGGVSSKPPVLEAATRHGPWTL